MEMKNIIVGTKKKAARLKSLEKEKMAEQKAQTPKEVTDEYVSEASVTALPRAYFYKLPFWKFFWVIVFLLGCFGTIMNTIGVIDSYFSYPSTISIDVRTNQSFRFPAVSVCNRNPIKRSAIQATECDEMDQLLSVENDFIVNYVDEHDSIKNQYPFDKQNVKVEQVQAWLRGISPLFADVHVLEDGQSSHCVSKKKRRKKRQIGPLVEAVVTEAPIVNDVTVPEVLPTELPSTSAMPTAESLTDTPSTINTQLPEVSTVASEVTTDPATNPLLTTVNLPSLEDISTVPNIVNTDAITEIQNLISELPSDVTVPPELSTLAAELPTELVSELPEVLSTVAAEVSALPAALPTELASDLPDLDTSLAGITAPELTSIPTELPTNLVSDLADVVSSPSIDTLSSIEAVTVLPELSTLVTEMPISEAADIISATIAPDILSIVTEIPTDVLTELPDVTSFAENLLNQTISSVPLDLPTSLLPEATDVLPLDTSGLSTLAPIADLLTDEPEPPPSSSQPDPTDSGLLDLNLGVTIATELPIEDQTLLPNVLSSLAEPLLPSEAPTLPTDAPTLPSDAPTLPSDAPTLPSDAPTLPSDAPTLPSEIPTLPSETPTLPSETPTLPSETPTLPSETPTLPSETPSPPTEGPPPPSETPTLPSETPTPPSGAPTPPSGAPTPAPGPASTVVPDLIGGLTAGEIATLPDLNNEIDKLNADKPTYGETPAYLTNGLKVSDRYNYRKMIHKSQLDDLIDLQDLITISHSVADRKGYNASELIQECTYDRSRCSHENFVHFYSLRYGNCYTFNSGDKERLRWTRKPGSDYGLRLTLNIDFENYVGLFAASYGAQIVVHDPDVVPKPEEEGVAVQPGKETALGVKLKEIHRLPPPYTGNCAEDGLPGRLEPFKPTDSAYTLRQCNMACRNYHLHDRCHCVDSALDDYRTCDLFNETDRQCRGVVISRLALDEDVPEYLGCECKAACTENLYSFTLSHSDWPTIGFQRLKMFNFYETQTVAQTMLDSELQAKNMMHMKNNFVRVQVYLETLAFEVVTESEAMTFSDLVSNVGGVLGMYLGLSLISFIELFQFIVLYIQAQMNKKVGPDPDELYGSKSPMTPSPVPVV